MVDKENRDSILGMAIECLHCFYGDVSNPGDNDGFSFFDLREWRLPQLEVGDIVEGPSLFPESGGDLSEGGVL